MRDVQDPRQGLAAIAKCFMMRMTSNVLMQFALSKILISFFFGRSITVQHFHPVPRNINDLLALCMEWACASGDLGTSVSSGRQVCSRFRAHRFISEKFGKCPAAMYGDTHRSIINDDKSIG